MQCGGGLLKMLPPMSCLFLPNGKVFNSKVPQFLINAGKVRLCLEYDVDFDGDDLHGYNVQEVPGIEECSELCDERPLCKGFTYHLWGYHIHKCFLKDTEIVNRINATERVVSALKSCYISKHFSEFCTTFQTANSLIHTVYSLW